MSPAYFNAPETLLGASETTDIHADIAAFLGFVFQQRGRRQAAVLHIARQFDRIENFLVAGAAADIAAEPFLDLLAVGKRIDPQAPRSPPSPCRECNSRTGWRRSCGRPAATATTRPCARDLRPSRSARPAPCRPASCRTSSARHRRRPNTAPHSPAPQPSLCAGEMHILAQEIEQAQMRLRVARDLAAVERCFDAKLRHRRLPYQR